MTATNYLWDPISDNVIEEFDDTGAAIAEYTTEPGLYGNVISQHRPDSGSRFFQPDANGSVTELTDESGAVTDTRVYSAFGETIQQTGTTQCPFAFVGRKGYYTESGLSQLFVRERRYHPARARWQSRDPIGGSRATRHRRSHRIARRSPMAIIAPVLHSYVYALNNPLRYTDASGLDVSVGSHGRFMWSVEVLPLEWQQLGVQALIRFEPYCHCPCNRISFIQVVTNLIFAGKTALDGLAELYGPQWTDDFKKWHENLMTGDGAFVDALPPETDVYYGAELQGDEWVSEGESGQVGSCRTGLSATLDDAPGKKFDETEILPRGLIADEFETCAVCIDSGEIYGCVTWGFESADVEEEGATIVTTKRTVKLKPPQFNATPSKTFDDAVAKAVAAGLRK